jgi:hypothetical protein
MGLGEIAENVWFAEARFRVLGSCIILPDSFCFIHAKITQ